jgi:hypothetical protein
MNSLSIIEYYANKQMETEILTGNEEATQDFLLFCKKKLNQERILYWCNRFVYFNSN